LNLPIPSPATATEDKIRVSSQSTLANTLTDIYLDDVNLAIWQYSLNDGITRCVESLIIQQPRFSTMMNLTPNNAYEHLADCLVGVNEKHLLCEHITLIVDMFCTLFDLKETGLRLKLIDKPMCPRFHVDRVPCRLVTTLHGPATQWLQHSAVNRDKLGAGNNGLADECSGLINPDSIVEQLACGDIALLKGENWFNNHRAGLVHRSPTTAANEMRLLLTLDFIN
jgi:hypothetical protein